MSKLEKKRFMYYKENSNTIKETFSYVFPEEYKVINKLVYWDGSAHPTFAHGMLGDRVFHSTVTHSPGTNKKPNSQLINNPNPLDSEPSYIFLQIKESSRWLIRDNGDPSWKLRDEDVGFIIVRFRKKIIDRINTKQ